MIDRRILAGALAVLVALVVLPWLPGRAAVRDAAAAAADDRLDDAVAVLEAPGWLPPSATRLHDLGVLHYRRGDVPRALAAWRSARDLSPRDPDLVHDLAVARQELPEAPPEPVGAAASWLELVTPAEVGVLALLAWAAAGLLAHAWRRTGRGVAGALAVTALAVGLSSMALQGRAARWRHPVAVTVERAVVRELPELLAGERFVLPPAAELRVQRASGDFLLIEDGTGRRGWVAEDAVAIADRAGLR